MGLRRVLGALFLAVFCYIFASFLGAIWRGDIAVVSDAERDVEILLIAGPIHYDILLPNDTETRADFAFLTEAGTPLHSEYVQWLAVGWGSHAFYTSAGRYSDIRAGVIWRAVMGDAAVIRFEIYGEVPLDHVDVHRLKISQVQLDLLRANILADLNGHTAIPDVGFSDTDVFYPAIGRFHLFQTCNVWVGRQMRAAGVDFGRWTPLPISISVALNWFAP